MLRLFVAIRPPRAVRDFLHAAMGGVSGARWQNDDQLHLTLRFIGEVNRHLADDIHAALGAVRHPGFDVAVAGIGLFERRGQPEVIWAGVAPQDPVRRLHNKVDQAIARAGIPPDQRAFLPHITLARMKRASGPVRDLIETQGGLAGPSFRVDRFALFESRLTPDGAHYSEIASYSLT